MTKRRKRLIVVGAVAAAVAAGVLLYLHFRQREYPFTISRQTTVLLGPLHADGKTIDYVAGLNQIYGQGATSENNAAALLVQAFGPELIYNDIRAETYALLGLPTPPPEGPYFVTLDDYLDAQGPRQEVQTAPSRSGSGAVWEPKSPWGLHDDNLAKAMAGPWSARDYPAVAAWLKANEQPLAMVAAAAGRPRYYVPSVSADPSGSLVHVLLPALSRCRSAARALAARAMLRVNSGDFEDAWSDLAACHRLGRLVGQGPTLIERLVGLSLAGLASQSTRALAASGRLTPAQVEKILAEMQALPPLPGFAEAVDRECRFAALDAVGALYRRYKYRRDGALDSLAGSGLGDIADVSVDWDRAMRTINAWCDRAVSGFGKPGFAERKAAVAVLKGGSRQPQSQSRPAGGLMARVTRALGVDGSAKLRKEYRRDPGKILLGMLMPRLAGLADLEGRATMEFRLTRLALALAAHKAETGGYPQSLAALTPRYLKELPEDLFVNRPLKYRREGAGYVLYSVGPNMVDDGGKEVDAEEHLADIVVRVE